MYIGLFVHVYGSLYTHSRSLLYLHRSLLYAYPSLYSHSRSLLTCSGLFGMYAGLFTIVSVYTLQVSCDTFRSLLTYSGLF